MSEQINMQSSVLMHYSIATTDGTVIESSYEDEPVQIRMSSGDLTEGMELAMLGLQQGDDQTLTLTPEQGFGIRDDDNINDMPLADFPEDLEPGTGMAFSFEATNGDEIPGTVIEVTDTHARIDFNHPLAGIAIVFRVTILGVDNDLPDDTGSDGGSEAI